MLLVSTDKEYIKIYAVILSLCLFYFLTIRDGHNWGGDFSMYIHHAKNIVDGTKYQDTGYIYNPSYPSLSPKASLRSKFWTTFSASNSRTFPAWKT